MSEYSYARMFDESWDTMMLSPLGDVYKQRFSEAKLCERCKENPPEVIPKISSYFAVCRQCEREIYND